MVAVALLSFDFRSYENHTETQTTHEAFPCKAIIGRRSVYCCLWNIMETGHLPTDASGTFSTSDGLKLSQTNNYGTRRNKPQLRQKSENASGVG